MGRQVWMQVVVEVGDRVASRTDQPVLAHHYPAVHQHRVLVRQLRRFLLDHLHDHIVYPAATGHLHMRLVFVVGGECRLANHAFVGAEEEEEEDRERSVFNSQSNLAGSHSPVMVLVLATPLATLGVREQVLLQVHELRVGLGADGTGVRLDSVVDHLVLLQVGALHEGLVAAVALVRLESAV